MFPFRVSIVTGNVRRIGWRRRMHQGASFWDRDHLRRLASTHFFFDSCIEERVFVRIIRANIRNCVKVISSIYRLLDFWVGIWIDLWEGVFLFAFIDAFFLDLIVHAVFFIVSRYELISEKVLSSSLSLMLSFLISLSMLSFLLSHPPTPLRGPCGPPDGQG